MAVDFKKVDWFKLALKLPAVIAGITSIVNKVKDATDGNKKEAVLSAIPDSVSLAEFAIDKDFINDPELANLISAYIDAEAVVAKAREALKVGILNKGK